MLNKVTGLLKGAMLVAGVAAMLGATVSTASADVFTVDASAYGGDPNFDADELQGGYEEILTVTSFDGTNGTFETVAIYNVGSFELGNVVVFGTGINNDYKVYALFSADGTFTCSGGECEFTATSGAGEVALYVDDDGDTAFTGGLPGDGTGGIASLLAIRTGDADDDLLATADLASGDGDTSGGAAQGNFDLTFSPFVLTTDGAAFFIAPNPFYLNANLEGNFDAFDPFEFNQLLNGSANAAFNGTAVPEPATLSLLGMALFGAGAAARRRKKA